jgi:ABC-type Mn2+/Zn2+ transport system ATPase subunit
MSTNALLTLRGASFGYGRRAVLAGVDLAVGRGELVGIAGPNGGGKSTLVRGILGLIPALAGSVERGGARLGYVPQQDSVDAVFPVTAEEVVRMGAYGRLRGQRALPAGERRFARECLERVGMSAHARQPLAALSGGQRQRVLVARALMMRPDLLIMDEPTSGVDRVAERQIAELVLELERRSALAVLIVSHQLEFLRRVTRRIVWVEDGRVEPAPPAAVGGS